MPNVYSNCKNTSKMWMCTSLDVMTGNMHILSADVMSTMPMCRCLGLGLTFTLAFTFYPLMAPKLPFVSPVYRSK